jgi:AcrR family transcriptional regulator
MTESNDPRERIVTAAVPLLAARGYAVLSADDIARAAGVSRGSVIYHFGGKEGVFQEVLRLIFFQHQQIVQRAKEEDEPERRLEVLVDLYLKDLETKPAYWKVYISLGLTDDTREWMLSGPAVNFREMYRDFLRNTFSALGFEAHQEAGAAFETFCTGLFWQYLNAPKTYPLGRMKKVLLSRFCRPFSNV